MIECYAIIKGGKIKCPVNMVSVYDGVYEFHLISDKEREKYGWYKCELYNENYDSRLYRRSIYPEVFFDKDKNKVIAQYTFYTYTIEEIQEKLCDQVDELFQVKLQTDVEVKINEFDNIIQYRNEIDRVSLLTAIQSAVINVTKGQPEKLIGFRTSDNITHQLQSSLMIDIGEYVLTIKYKLLESLQKHKDNIRNINIIENVINYNIEENQ